MNADALLGPDDPAVYQVENPSGRSPFVITCDHAGCRLPAKLGTLGLSARDLESHIGWDLGIAGLGRMLARELDAFLILQTYSRLVIDVNRPLGTPESIVKRSEHVDIRGNHQLTDFDESARATAVFWPYHMRIRSELERRLHTGQPSLLIGLHSFTPVFMGVARSVEVGVLYGDDDRLGHALLSALKREPDLVIGDNEPYAVTADTDYTILEHGARRGIPHVELELRQDLIAREVEQRAWARRLAKLLAPIASHFFPR